MYRRTLHYEARLVKEIKVEPRKFGFVPSWRSELIVVFHSGLRETVKPYSSEQEALEVKKKVEEVLFARGGD